MLAHPLFNSRFRFTVLGWLLLLSPLCLAEADFKQEYGRYTVHHSVFTSTSIAPEIATLHDLRRGKDVVLINITVIDNDDPNNKFGRPAKVSGTAANLMQQQRQLEFKEIKEPGTIYYIASLRHINEEVIHFNIEVQLEGKREPLKLKFTKTLYINP